LREKRFFAPSTCWGDQQILLDKSQTHHLISVLRSKKGGRVRCFDDTGRECEAEILTDDSDGAVLSILEFLDVDSPNELKVVLAQSVIKSSRMDMIIQKAVELGVGEIVPFFSCFSVVKLDSAKKDSKRKRWQRIAVEAAKQCKRTTIPSISEFVKFDGLVEEFPKYDKVFLADPYVDNVSIEEHLKGAESVLLIVGPEGGFESSECDLAKRQPNCIPFKFNRNILRAETAALSCVAVIQYMRLKSKKNAG